MTQATDTPKTEHYHLITGEILCRAKDGDNVQGVRLNAIITSDDGKLPVALIGRAQQALQMQFFKRMNDPEIQVVDVVILGVSPLGEFTHEAFHAVPAGVEVRESALA